MDLTAARRTKSINQLILIIDGVAERLGGWEKVVKDWSRQATDPSCSQNQQLAVLRTIIDIRQRIAEQQEREAEREPTIDDALRLHQRGKLAPLLREMLADGRLTADHLDPPPSEFDE